MSIFSKLFNSEKKDTTYSGPKPYGSLLQAQGGQDYYNRILGRSQGQGVGYSHDYVEKASNPVIARMRNKFSSYDIPELKSDLSLTGRRKGSSGFGQIAKAYENQGLNEEAAYAPIYAAAEEAKRADTNTGITQLGEFNKGDFDARNILSNFEYADNSRQVSEANQRRSNESAGLNRAGQLITSVGLAPFTGGASLAGASGAFGGQSYDPYGLQSLITARQPVPTKTPNYAALDNPGYKFSMYGQNGGVRG